MKPETYDRIFLTSCFVTGGLAGIAVVSGCTTAELQESGGNVVGAVGDAVGAIAADPSKAFTPEGIAVLVATFLTGFFGRQAASLAKWTASGTGGWLVRVFGKFASLFRK